MSKSISIASIVLCNNKLYAKVFNILLHWKYSFGEFTTDIYLKLHRKMYDYVSYSTLLI